MPAIVRLAAPAVKSTQIMSHAEFSAFCARQLARIDKDGFAPPPPKFDDAKTSLLWRLGYQLGSGGSSPKAPECFTPAEREAFEFGTHDGDHALDKIDPDYAAFLRERSKSGYPVDNPVPTTAETQFPAGRQFIEPCPKVVEAAESDAWLAEHADAIAEQAEMSDLVESYTRS